MSIFRKLGLASVLLAVVAVGIISCGGGTNNDQGTSFSADGFVYKDPSDGEIKPEIGITGLTVPVNIDASSTGYYFVTSGTNACMALKNHLCKAAIKVVRIECDFVVQGADPGVQLPTSVHNSTYNVDPSGYCSFDNTAQSSSESSSSSITNAVYADTVYSCFPMLTSDQISYLMVNQNRLPALPYTIDSICRAIGVTQSGDVLITNDLYFPITLIDHAECCTGTGVNPDAGGYETGTGTGGTPYMQEQSSSSESSSSSS